MFILATFRILSFRTLPFIPPKKSASKFPQITPWSLDNFPHSAIHIPRNTPSPQTHLWEMASELLCIVHKNANVLARGRLGMRRKAKATSGCQINVVCVRPHCPRRPRYLGRPHYTAKACVYSCQHRLWRHAGVGEFGERGRDNR